MTIPSQVLSFAGENIAVYKMFADYYNHYRALQDEKGVEFQTHAENENGVLVPISFSEKQDRLTNEIVREVMRVSGISNLQDFPLETWANNPNLKWATFAVISAMIDMVLPEAVINHIGMYSDVRTIGWGDSAAFDISPRDLFVVSKAGRSKRTTELHKDFKGQITVVPEPREMTVFVSLMKVLAGKESLAELVMKMVKSFEISLSYDVYSTMSTAMAALSTTASTGLRVAGWSESEFVRLSDAVSTWNRGARPVAVGTRQALANIMPSDANYRFDLDSDYVKVGFVRNFKGTDLLVLPQVADFATPFGLKLENDRIWIIAPSVDKPVKVVLEGNVLAQTSDAYANANLTQTSTMVKSWGTAIATSAVAAEISLA